MKQLKKTVVLVMNKTYVFDMDEYESQKYSFELKESGTITISLNVTHAKCGDLYLYDISDTRFIRREFYDADERLHNFSKELLAGTYALKISTDNNEALAGSFSLMFTPSGETVAENYMNNNNQFGIATPYTIGQSMKGFFVVNDNVDVYKVKVKK